jgi:hypothetical protein
VEPLVKARVRKRERTQIAKGARLVGLDSWALPSIVRAQPGSA